jgi:nicotinamide riboside kinase
MTTTVKLVTIALLGADGTGKKKLAKALAQALPTTSATASTLRWQITTETPLQRLLEHAQASATHPDSADLDTESTEFQSALAQQCRFDHTLLLGLDLTQSRQALRPQSTGERSHIDTLLRRSLIQAEVPFQVIYGVGDELAGQALAAVSATPAKTSCQRKPWVWVCDKCSDPGCEHRLLSDLLLNR